jgi:two-component system nitrogen regulation response regulator GlnG
VSPGAVPAPLADAPRDHDLERWIAARLQAGTTNLYAEVLSRVERQLLLETLQHTGQNRSEAARILGISRSTLRLKLAALGLQAD